MKQSNKISFRNQSISVGIDVHKNSWAVTAIAKPFYMKRTIMPPHADCLLNYLTNEFPDAEYIVGYESGFTGFSTYYAITELGMECHILNAADIPTSQYDRIMKDDKLDSRKIAEVLLSGNFREVFPRPKDDLDDRSVCRHRAKLQKQIAGYKTATKHLLYTHGIEVPEQFGKNRTYWSKAFTLWLRSVNLMSNTNVSMNMLVDTVETLRRRMLDATRHIRALSCTPKYQRLFKAVYSVPGVGSTTAMYLLCEVGTNVSRFPNERAFASYLGIIPTRHNSGEKVASGKKTFRGNKVLGCLLIEASWKAIINNPELCVYYQTQVKNMNPQKAIIKVARKLSNIIFAKMKAA